MLETERQLCWGELTVRFWVRKNESSRWFTFLSFASFRPIADCLLLSYPMPNESLPRDPVSFRSAVLVSGCGRIAVWS